MNIEEFIEEFKNFTTNQLTQIYNSYYSKNIHRLRTKKEALLEMKKIAIVDYRGFRLLADKLK